MLEIYQFVRRGAAGRLPVILAADHHGAGELAAFRAWLQQRRSRVNQAIRSVLGRGPQGERCCQEGIP